jgi:hypothetical protein
MGHHLTTQLFGSSEPTQFLVYAGYKEHLTDAAELAADVLVSVGACPQDAATQIFRHGGASRSRDDSIEGTDALERILRYVGQRYRWRLNSLALEEKLHVLAVLIHYGKVRQALLDEYDI